MTNFLLVLSVIFSSHFSWSQTPETTTTTVVPVQTTKSPALKFEVVDTNFESTEKIVIEQDTIQKSRSTNVAQVLANQANINVVTTNVQPNSIFIRGGDSGHVLILVDDVPTYDSSTLQKSFNLSSINLSNVKKIEILKGSQAVLYGGQALSAVIKIYTIPENFESSGKISGQLRRQLGSDANAQANFALSDSTLIGLDVRGVSQFNASPVLESKKPKGYKQQIDSVQAVWAQKISEKLNTITKLNYAQDESQLPDSGPGNRALDSDDAFSMVRTSGVSINLKNTEQFKALVSIQNTDRFYLVLPTFNDRFKSETSSFRVEYGDKLTQSIGYQVGTSYSRDVVGITKKEVKILDQYSQQFEGYFGKVNWNPIEDSSIPLKLETGYRLETKKGENSISTAQLGLTWNEDLSFEVSSGSKSPSISQRFDPRYGNPNLTDEKALNFNLSYRVKLSRSNSVAAAIFDSNYRNLIGTTCNSQFVCESSNIRNARIVGGELSTAGFDEVTGVGIKAYLAYQEPRDLGTGTWLLRRPLRTAGIQLRNEWNDRINSVLEISHTGSRRDSEISLSAYTLVNLTANYRLQDDLDVFGRIDNLQNKIYETTFGYYVQGSELRAGLEKRF